MKRRFLFPGNFISHPVNDLDLELEFARKSNQRNHDFGSNLDAFGLHRGGGFKHRPGLHFGNFGKRNPKPATAMSEHRIEFMQLVHPPRNVFDSYAELVRQFILLGMIVR